MPSLPQSPTVLAVAPLYAGVMAKAPTVVLWQHGTITVRERW
ncbi:MAG: hypothetical protein WA751_09755 [Candidatus Dormiibacterota bacterium]